MPIIPNYPLYIYLFAVRAVIIDASGVVEMDLAALCVIDELVTEMQKQQVEVYIAAACPRVAKSLEAYDLLDEVRQWWYSRLFRHAKPNPSACPHALSNRPTLFALENPTHPPS